MCYDTTMEGWGEIPGPYFCLNRQCVRAVLSPATGAGTKERGLTLSPRRLLPWWGGHGDARKGTAVNGVQGRADRPS